MNALLSYIWTYRYRVALGLLALLLVDSGKLIIPQIVRVTVDQVTEGNQSWLLVFGVSILGIGLVISVLRFLWRYWLLGTARRVRRDVRSQLYRRLLTYPSRFFDDHQTGDLMAHFSNDTGAVMRASGIGLLAIADFTYMTVLTIVFMLYINVRLTAYAFVPLPFLSVFVYVFGRIIHNRFQIVQDTFSDMSDRVQEALSGIHLVKSFSREREFEEHFSDINEAYRDQNLNLIRYQGLLRPGIMLFSGVSMLIVLYFGGAQVVQGTISLGELVAFTQYLAMMTWPMMALGMGVNLFQRGVASMERINNLLDVEPEVRQDGNGRTYQGEGSIDVDELTFSYDGEPVLDDLSMSVAPGTSVGVLGRTGSGKTTLIKLLTRVYDPPEESIFLDGEDICSYTLKSLRERIGVVPQDGFLFSTSIRDNIAFGRPDVSMESIQDVARTAGIHHEIERMPNGYDTHVGEDGVALSGGQKQRVSIARALLTDPDMLLLDDAFSSVDPKKEEDILQNLKPELEERTCLVVSHRVATVKRFDHVVVMDGGKVVEEGTHRELKENNGLYADLLTLQQRREEVHG